MDKSLVEKQDYGNWVSKKFVYIPGAISLLFWVTSFAFSASIVVAAIFFLVALYFAYARYRFSPAGGDVQTQIQQLVLQHLDWNGNGRGWILDVATAHSRLSWHRNMLKRRLLESITGAKSGNTQRVFANEMQRLIQHFSYKNTVLTLFTFQDLFQYP